MVSRKDEFFEQKTPAHDALQLYVKAHLNNLVLAYYQKYYIDKLFVETGELVPDATIKSEVSIQEPYKKHIVVDALIRPTFTHSKLAKWFVDYYLGSIDNNNDSFRKISDGDWEFLNYHLKKFLSAECLKNIYMKTTCVDHASSLAIFDLSKEIQQAKRIQGYLLGLNKAVTIYGGSKDPLKQQYHRSIIRLCLRLHSLSKDVLWAAVCERQLYLKEGCRVQPHKTILLELKPRIFSFGDVLRQIHEYESIVRPDAMPLLVTPDCRFDKDFQSEGIAVLHVHGKKLEAFAAERNIAVREHDFDSTPSEQMSHVGEPSSKENRLQTMLG